MPPVLSPCENLLTTHPAGCTITSCGMGVAVDEPATAHIANNDISFNQVGIAMHGRGTIRDNVVWGNLSEAVDLPPEVASCTSCRSVRLCVAQCWLASKRARPRLAVRGCMRLMPCKQSSCRIDCPDGDCGASCLLPSKPAGMLCRAWFSSIVHSSSWSSARMWARAAHRSSRGSPLQSITSFKPLMPVCSADPSQCHRPPRWAHSPQWRCSTLWCSPRIPAAAHPRLYWHSIRQPAPRGRRHLLQSADCAALHRDTASFISGTTIGSRRRTSLARPFIISSCSRACGAAWQPGGHSGAS